MGTHNLDCFFNPKSIAVIGASERSGRIGAHLLKNLMDGGYGGSLFPVNPKRRMVMERATFPSIGNVSESIDGGVDLALIAIPIEGVAEIIRQCVDARVKTAVIVSAGGKETGAEGELVESKILEEARRGGLRVIGPNCLGVMAPGNNLNASFSAQLPDAGNLALVSQSGAICTAILDLSLKEGIGFSHFVSIGSMIDVDFGDMIDFLGRQPSVKNILLYVEQLTNVRKFISAARAVSRVKPIIVLKAGRSRAGALAAASHTGSLAGEDTIYDAAFRRAGIIRVETIEELFDCAELTGKVSRVKGSCMGVLTNGGGPGVMAVDAIDKCGLHLAELDRNTVIGLNDLLPSYWSGRNPVDILGDADPERYVKAINLLLDDRSVDGLLVILTPQAGTDPLGVAESLIQLAGKSSLPLFAVWMGGRNVESAISALNSAGIPTFSSPERAVVAFSYMVQHNRNLQLLKEIPRRFATRPEVQRQKTRRMIDSALGDGSPFMQESTARSLLEAYGIIFPQTLRAESGEQAAAIAEEIGGPVVLKILSPDISHKTDAGGVELNLSGRERISAAFDAIVSRAQESFADARIRGVSVQPYIINPEYELMLGVKRDQIFGPVILFGMGGIFSEILRDTALALPPLNRLLIQRLIGQTKVSSLLSGYRNLIPLEMEQLELMIISLSQLVTDIPEIAELDINPIVVKKGKPIAVDARIRVTPTTVQAPLHLVISPYPSQYEQYVTTKSGRRIFIRPIQPEDGDLFLKLFETLSPTSVYYRFFSHLRELRPEMLATLTQVDYDRHLALVAFDADDREGKMLGAARIIADPDIIHAEFSILVGDPWQGQGIGAALLLSLLKAAKQQGGETIWGTVLRENRQMIQLGKRYGFNITHQLSEGTCELRIDLNKARLED